jgi:hypothetical protein
MIGPISLVVKQMGARSAGNPHAACDAEGTGNVAWTNDLPARQSSTLLIGGIEETSASFEARSAPRSYPTISDIGSNSPNRVI